MEKPDYSPISMRGDMVYRKVLYWGVVISVCLLLSTGCLAWAAEPEMEQVCDPKLLKAYHLLKNQKFEAAIAEFKTHLERNPNFVDAHNGLGLTYLKIGKLDEAAKEFEASLKLESGNSHAVLYLGMVYVQKEQFRQAVDIWQKYHSKLLPLVEKEIRRQMTLLRMKVIQQSNKEAMEREKQLQATGAVAEVDPNVVAVCYYQDLSRDKSLRPFRKGLTAMLITTLSKIKSIKVVERLRLQSLFEEMALGMTGIVDKKTAPRVGKLLGAGRMVTGVLSLGSIQTTSNLTLTGTGVAEGSHTNTIEQNRFFELPGIIVGKVAEMADFELSPGERQAIGVPLTTSMDAVLAFGQGLMALDAGNYEAAAQHFQAALTFDPNFQTAVIHLQATPPPQAPSPRAIRTMSNTQVSQSVSNTINNVMKQLNQVDCQIEITLLDGTQQTVTTTQTGEQAETEPELQIGGERETKPTPQIGTITDVTVTPLNVLTEQIIEQQQIAEQIEQVTTQTQSITETVVEETIITPGQTPPGETLPSLPGTPQ